MNTKRPIFRTVHRGAEEHGLKLLAPPGSNARAAVHCAMNESAETGTRYAALQRARVALRGRSSAQAAEIIRATLARALDALS